MMWIAADQKSDLDQNLFDMNTLSSCVHITAFSVLIFYFYFFVVYFIDFSVRGSALVRFLSFVHNLLFMTLVFYNNVQFMIKAQENNSLYTVSLFILTSSFESHYFINLFKSNN